MRLGALGAMLLLAVMSVGTVGSAAPSEDSAVVVKIAAARELPSKTSVKAKAALAATKTKLAAGDVDGAKAAFSQWLKTHKPSEAEAIKVAEWLVRDSVLEKNPKLAAPADRLRFHSEQVAALKSYLAELKQLRKSGAVSVKVRLLVLTPAYAKGAVAFTWAEAESVLDQKELGALIDKGDAALATAMAESSGWQLKLHDALQKQQQAYQIVSSMLKSMHDTAKAIIQNIKA